MVQEAVRVDRKPESFIKGALILSLATLVSRILGALYKPIVNDLFLPYDGMGGERGMGLAGIPYVVYQVVLAFTAVGLNVGISKLVAERLAVRDQAGARRVFRYSFITMGALGLAGTVAFWFGAPYMAAAMSHNALEAIPGFRATAPALFFVSLMAAYRGLFQGFQQMTPNAVSQLIEQLVRIGVGIFLVSLLAPRDVALGAAGFNFGDVAGAMVGLLYLVWMARRSAAGMWGAGPGAKVPYLGQEGAPSPWQLMKRVLVVSLPIAVIGAIVPLMGVADVFVVLNRLTELGAGSNEAQAAFGQLTNALVIVLLPGVFTLGLYTSLVPAMAESMAVGNIAQVRARAQTAYRITTLLALPAFVGLLVLAEGVYRLLFPAGAGGTVLGAMSWAVPFMMLQQTTSGLLQGIGRIGVTVRNQVIGLLVKTGVTYWLVGLMGVEGAGYATAAAFLVAGALNIWEVERRIGRTIDWNGMFIRPGIAALVMGGALWAIQGALSPAFGSPRLLALLLIAIGGVTYAVMLLLVGGVKAEDISRLPRMGQPLLRVLRRVGLIRPEGKGEATP